MATRRAMVNEWPGSVAVPDGDELDFFAFVDKGDSHDLLIELGRGSRLRLGVGVRMSGLWLARVHVEIVHKGEGSHSDARLRGAAFESSKVELSCGLSIEQGAAGEEAAQSAKVILFSPNASGFAKPAQRAAEAKAKASHGASITGVPKDADFLLATRGIPLKERREIIAQAHLSSAFALAGEEALAKLAPQVYASQQGGGV